MRRNVIAIACLLAACGNPTDPAGWAKRAAGRSRMDEKLQALAEVRRAQGDKKAAVPYLLEVVKEGPARARAQAAVALGEIGDPSAVDGLIKAMSKSTRKEDLESNRHIADALGELRARDAVGPLSDLVTSPDGFVQVAAVDALGRIGDPAAVDVLVNLVTADGTEPFTAKKALLALGQIADPRAAPAILRMLFVERRGVTFFPEAAFAATQIGAPMATPLLAILEEKDKDTASWAKEKGVLPGALVAKSAQLMGDVGGPSAVPALLAKLSYRDSDPGVAMYVHVLAAESLGRMRAKDGVRTLADLASRERDPNVRDRYCDALARIGDPSAIPSLKSAAASGDWDLREGPLTAISRLGSAEETSFIAAAKEKECAKGCKPEVQAAFSGMLARLDAAKACKDPGCWAGKLADARSAVRDRAALELGAVGGAAHAAALGDAIVRPVDNDADVAARYHAVLALGWIASREKIGPKGAEIADKIDAMKTADRGRNLTTGVNEEAWKLGMRLRRAASK